MLKCKKEKVKIQNNKGDITLKWFLYKQNIKGKWDNDVGIVLEMSIVNSLHWDFFWFYSLLRKFNKFKQNEATWRWCEPTCLCLEPLFDLGQDDLWRWPMWLLTCGLQATLCKIQENHFFDMTTLTYDMDLHTWPRYHHCSSLYQIWWPYLKWFLRYEFLSIDFLSSLNFDQVTDGQTESDAYESTVHMHRCDQKWWHYPFLTKGREGGPASMLLTLVFSPIAAFRTSRRPSLPVLARNGIPLLFSSSFNSGT